LDLHAAPPGLTLSGKSGAVFAQLVLGPKLHFEKQAFENIVGFR
jgi:hypothetical protein